MLTLSESKMQGKARDCVNPVGPGGGWYATARADITRHSECIQMSWTLFKTSCVHRLYWSESSRRGGALGMTSSLTDERPQHRM